MLIFPNQKVIYVATPKCASMALHNTLFPLVEQDLPWPVLEILRRNDGHSTLAEVQDDLLKCGIALDDYYKFCVVRNPWDRAVSLGAWLYPEEFVKNIDSAIIKAIHSGDVTARQQVDYVAGTDQQIKFENLEAEIKALDMRFDLGIEVLPVVNESNRDRGYQRYFTDMVKAEVDSKYADDIATLGYTYA